MDRGRRKEKIFQLERQIEVIGGSLSATERHKAAMLIASCPYRYMHDGQVDINLAHADAGRIQNWPRYLGGDEDNVTINPQRGTGATVRESLDATINRT